MFSNVGWGEILVILLVAVVILGPDRLPEAAKYLGQGLRKVRDWANSAQDQLKENVDEDFGDLKDLQKPVKELARIRAMGPKAAAVHYLLDDDDSLLDVDLGVKDLSMDLKELTGLNERDEATFLAAPDGPVRGSLTESGADAAGGATPAIAPDAAAGFTGGSAARSGVVTPQQAVLNPESLAQYRPTSTNTNIPAAPSAPVTVGDSWAESGEDEVELSFDEDDQ